MYVEFFQAYPGTSGTSDPGYADFRINCAGRRYSGSCDPDGSKPRRLRTATQASFTNDDLAYKGRGFRRMAWNQTATLVPRLESVLQSYIAGRFPGWDGKVRKL